MKWLKVGVGLNANHSIKNYGIVSNFDNGVAKDSYGLAMNMMPWWPAYNEDGSIMMTEEGDLRHNVLRNIDSAWNEYRYYGVNMSSYAEATLFPWLKWRTNLGAQYRNSRQGSFYGENYTNPFGFDSTSPGVAYNRHSQDISWTLENLIYINKTFKDIHTLNITLLQSAERYRTEDLSMRAYEVVYPTSLWYNIGQSNKSKYAPGSSYSTWSRASYMARVNYSLMDKYLLTLTGRYDGASVLADGNKWDFFPSAAIAWRMEQEEFIKHINWINQLKFRVGYGVTGNSSISPYQTSGSCTSTYANIPFGVGNAASNVIGTKTSVMPNYSLGWEKTSSVNIGLDFSILNNRISGSLEYYQAETSDLLMNKSLPVITGYALIQSNVGKTQNKGVELSLSTINVKTRDFTWQTDWTFSTNSEKIKELANGSMQDTSGPWFVGHPINIFWDYKYDRIWQDTPEDNKMMQLYQKIGNLTFLPGQYKICDQPLEEVPEGTEGSKTVILDDGTKVSYMDNGFGRFTDDDKVIYNKSPKWTGGLNNSFTYKDWNFSFFTYFRFGNTYYGLSQTIGRRLEKDVWSPTNTNAKFAQPTTATRTSTYDGARNYTKGNMVLVRNIALSYTVPQKFLNKYGINNAQIYTQVLNPFLFGGELVKAGINPDDVTGWDASNHIGGQTNNTCITRSFVLGGKTWFLIINKKKMKKYLYAGLLACTIASCTDDFLKEEMVSTITQDYFNTEQGLDQLIVGTYNAERVKWGYSEGVYMFETGHDCARKSGDTDLNMYSTSKWSSTGDIGKQTDQFMGFQSKSSAGFLINFFPIIDNCNKAINIIRNNEGKGQYASNKEYAAQRLSEVLFNRAYSYYNLNTILGDIYFSTTSSITLPSNYVYTRTPAEEMYKVLISDLRYAVENLPENYSSGEFGRATKYAAAHLLSKIYLHREQGKEYGTVEYGRNADGSIDNSNPKSYLGMLYKGKGTADLDSCIYYASMVIDKHPLAYDYADLFDHSLDDFSCENTSENVLNAVFSEGGDNYRYGLRVLMMFVGNYVGEKWGLPDYCWEYGTKPNFNFHNSDFGFDVFTDKINDSRFQKSFRLEYVTGLNTSGSIYSWS